MNARPLFLLTAAVLLASAGCSTPECVSAADCGSGMACQAEKCVEPLPASCSPACSGTTPVCDAATRSCVTCTEATGCATGLTCDTSFAGGRCVGCATDGECSGAKPICDESTQACVTCNADRGCTAGKSCDVSAAGGRCVGCLADAQCSGSTPVCDPAAQSCVGCLEDTDCSGGTPYCAAGSKTCVACVEPAGCATALKVVGARSTSSTEVEVEFERMPDPQSLVQDGSQFTFTGGLTASAAALTSMFVRVTTGAQTPGTKYTVTVATSLYDLDGVAVGASDNTAEFTTPLTQARLVVNEINPNIPNSRDLIEFLVVAAGTTKQMTVVEEGKTGDPLTFSTFPDVAVQVGDLVVLHLNPVDADDPKASERQSKSESTAAKAFPNAWDFVGGSAAVTFSNRLIKVVAADGTVQDAVAFVKSDAVPPLAGGFELAVQIAQDEGQWSPGDCDGAECTYTSTPSVLDVSVDWKDLGLEGGNASSASMSRVPGADTDSKADWVLKATGASFGSANP